MRNPFRWLHRLSQRNRTPQAHIVWSSEPPTPIESVRLPLPAPYSIQAEADAVLAEALRTWRQPGLAKTVRLMTAPAPAPAVVDDTLLLQRARPIMFEPLPLMSNPNGPNPAWRERTITSLHDLSRWLNDEQRVTLELAERHPDWLHIDIHIFAPKVPTWQRKGIGYQVCPHLRDILRRTLHIDLPECGIEVSHTDDAHEVMWSALLWIDDKLDDGLDEVAA